MIRKTIYLFLCTSFLLAEAPTASSNNQLSSTHASYNGNALVLQGRVHLDHGIGKMSADEAFLEKQETGKDFPFSLIQLKKDVLLSLKNKAELRCDLAALDFNDLKGVLSSGEQEKVSYKDLFKQEGSSFVPFHLMSRLIDLQLIKYDSATEATQYGIQSLIAKKEVQIEYAKEFVLTADEASYQNTDPQNSNFQTGIIEAYPTSAKSRCKIAYQGENIEADFIHVDIKNSQIQMKTPKGSIPSGLFTQNKTSPIFFYCQDLLWNHEKETLLLKNQVSIEEKTLGSLYAENEMLIIQGKSQNKKNVQSIHIDGVSLLEHKDAASGWNHKITSFGSLHVDGLKGHITLASPPNKEKQVCYEDQDIILQADQALIEYSEESDFKPLSVALQGNVTIKSTSASPLQLGMADRLPTLKPLFFLLFLKKEFFFKMKAKTFP